VEEICEIRKVNEVLAARWAMERITLDELGALEANIAISKKEIGEGNLRPFVERDAEFHEILVRASGSKRLLELCQLLRRHMLRYRVKSLYLKETALQALLGHRGILDCLRKHDKQGIERAIREHLEFAKESIQKHVPWEEEARGSAGEGEE
jgi:DNA-binding GntR family transcriptional regulator